MKKASRTVEIASNGKTIKFNIFVERGVIDMADKSEGFSGHLKTYEREEVIVFVDGKQFEKGQLQDYRNCNHIPGLKLPAGAVGRVGKVMLTEVNFELIAKAQAEAIAEASTDAEYAELKAAEVAKKNAAQIESAKRIVEQYESGKCLKSYEAATQYNNLHNEGGDGYVPEVITTEMYRAAKARLA
jgi:hypothetical protein